MSLLNMSTKVDGGETEREKENEKADVQRETRERLLMR